MLEIDTDNIEKEQKDSIEINRVKCLNNVRKY